MCPAARTELGHTVSKNASRLGFHFPPPLKARYRPMAAEEQAAKLYCGTGANGRTLFEDSQELSPGMN